MIWKPDNCNCICEITDVMDTTTIGHIINPCPYHVNFEQCLYDNKKKNNLLHLIQDSITIDENKYLNYYYDEFNQLQIDYSGLNEIEIDVVETIVSDYTSNNPYPIVEVIISDNTGIPE